MAIGLKHADFAYTEYNNQKWSYVTLDHNTSHKCQFLEIEIYTSE